MDYETYKKQQEQERQARQNSKVRAYIKNSIKNYAKNYARNVFNNSSIGQAINGYMNAGAGAAAGTAASGTATGSAAAGTTTGATVGGTAAGTTAGTAAGTTAGTAAGGTAGGTAAGGAAGGAASGAAGGILGAIAGLILSGANRKRASQASSSLLGDTLSESQHMAKAIMPSSEELEQQPFEVNPIYENALNNSYGSITGGAAPLQGQVSTQNNMQLPSSVSQQAQLSLPTAAPQQNPPQVAAPQQTAPQQQGFLSKLANGLTDFSRGYNENLNNSFNPNNLSATKFTETVAPNNTNLADYQKQLTLQGYSPEVVSAIADKKNSGFRNIDEWIKNNPNAYSTTKTYDKTKMGRLGEAFGSLSRFAQKPGVQAAVAGGLSTLLTGNPMIGLGMAYKYGNQRAKNNIYEQALQKYGITPNPSVFGTVGPQDLNAIGNLYYKDLLDIYRNKQLEEQKSYHKGTLEQRTRANDIREKQGDERNRINATKAANARSGKESGKAAKAEYTKNLNKDLAGYSTLTPEQKKKIRPKMIETYGKDFLSQESKFSPKEEKKYTAPGL